MQLSQSSKKSLVNLTPLIDVVFILLIFFMLASNFIRWHYIELSVSNASDVEVDHQKISIITIDQTKSYFLNDKKLPLELIIVKIRKKLREDIDHPIVVQPTKGTDVQLMVDVLNLLKNFSGNNISISKPEDNEK